MSIKFEKDIGNFRYRQIGLHQKEKTTVDIVIGIIAAYILIILGHEAVLKFAIRATLPAPQCIKSVRDPRENYWPPLIILVR